MGHPHTVWVATLGAVDGDLGDVGDGNDHLTGDNARENEERAKNDTVI